MGFGAFLISIIIFHQYLVECIDLMICSWIVIQIQNFETQTLFIEYLTFLPELKLKV